MFRDPKKAKAAALLLSLVLLATSAVGGTLAFLTAKTGSIKNIFSPSKMGVTVEEDLESGTKSNVKLKNLGNTDGWLRAAVVITWQDDSGNVYGTPPVAGTDYEITYNQTGWLEGSDGFWYWTKPVAADDSTGVLISSCSYVTGKAPEGYHLVVDIVASALQSKPAYVFNDNWGAASGLMVSGTPDTDGYCLTKKGGS